MTTSLDPGPAGLAGKNEEQAPPALQLSGVHQRYDRASVLRGVDLVIDQGEVCALLGRNGAGKSTIASIVSGLIPADAGGVRVLGIDRPASRVVRHLVGLAPQEIGIYPLLTVREALSFFATLAGITGRERTIRVDEVAEQLHLTELMNRRGGTLSGGEQRRLHVGMALVHRPRLLLLDEPTAGVDVETRAAFLATIRRLAGHEGLAICYCTHYLTEIEQLDATVAILHDGQIVARGSVEEVVARRSRPGLVVTFDRPPSVPVLPWATTVSGTALWVDCPDPAVELPGIVAACAANGGTIISVDAVRSSLETVFLDITGDAGRGDVDAT